jgi:Arc/MetJ family transcription regulator
MLRMSYKKTTVEIDLDELDKAQGTLRTRGIKETVNAALREVNRKAALEEAAAYVLAGGMHLPDEKAWAAAREPRT